MPEEVVEAAEIEAGEPSFHLSVLSEREKLCSR
jgi:hypothetical protein